MSDVVEWDIELKVWPPFYADVESGAKPFEVRIDDRGYEVGQILWLREWQPDVPRRGEIHGRYTDRGCFRRISYILRDAERFGLQGRYCILGLALSPPVDGGREEMRSDANAAAADIAVLPTETPTVTGTTRTLGAGQFGSAPELQAMRSREQTIAAMADVLAGASDYGPLNFAGDRVLSGGIRWASAAAVATAMYEAAGFAAPAWQPIESAPKSPDAWVDLWHPTKGRVTDAHWITNGLGYEGWHARCGERDWNMSDGGYTHWMPLPTPPCVEKG